MKKLYGKWMLALLMFLVLCVSFLVVTERSALVARVAHDTQTSRPTASVARPNPTATATPAAPAATATQPRPTAFVRVPTSVRVPAEGEGVLHVKAQHITVAPDLPDDAMEPVIGEFWYDPSTKDARYEQGGTDGEVRHITLRRGLTASTWTSDGGVTMVEHTTYVSEINPALQYARNPFLRYKDAVAHGRAELLRSEMVNGRRVDVLEDKQVFDGGQEVTLHIRVDRESGLTHSMVFFEDGGATGLREMYRKHTSYSVIEYVPRDQVPQDTFSVPKVSRSTHRTYMTIERTREFDEFDLYWVGPALGSRKLDTILFEGTLNGDHKGRAPTVLLVYLAGEDRIGIQFNQGPVAQAPPPCRGEGTTFEVDGKPLIINGNTVKLCGAKGSNDNSVHLKVGGTYVSVSARTREASLKLVELLRKLE